MIQPILLFALLFSSSFLFGQMNLVPVSLDERIIKSSVIVEGTVIEQSCFRGITKNHIYTENRIQIQSVLKGASAKEISIITEGGQLENQMMIASDLLKLKKGETGIFFCVEAKANLRKQGSFETYSGPQGFIKINLVANSATDPFNKYNAEDLRTLIETKTGQKRISVAERTAVNRSTSLIPFITDISPDNVSAGTNNTITITGSGFGNSRGGSSVGFANADDGGQTSIKPIDSQYKSWSDSQIIVEVPTEAGTGTIEVTVGGITGSSAEELTIPFARTQFEYEGKIQSAILVDVMAGGYPWRMYSGFYNDSLARTSFTRAFNRWRCVSGVNWFLGSVTDVDKTDRDNLNIIRFDEGEELPAGVLGVCYSYYEGCTENQWYVSEYDIVFDDDANWEFGPDAPIIGEYDFETVAVHELGHGHQLGHVINSQDLMHYSITTGISKRQPSSADIDGAKLVLSQSSKSICNFGAMKPLTSDVCEDSYFAYFESEPPTIYPLPVTSTLYISYFLTDDQDVDVRLIDLTGKTVSILAQGRQKKGEHTIVEDVSAFGLAKGMYILKSNINNHEYASRVISIN